MVWFNKKKLAILSFLFLLTLPIIAINFSVLYNSNLIINDSLSISDTSPNISLSELPPIDYNTLNESWYNPNLEMIIVVPEGNQEFIDAVEPLKEWKNQKGVKTMILSNYSSYEGVDAQEQIRNMIKTYYESDGIRWVLLAGDAQNSLIPIREVYNPDTIRANEEFEGFFSESVGNEYYKPTDYYYAALNGTWDEDEDKKYGESAEDNANDVDEIDWIPEVYVGRFPASTAEELEIMVNKTIDYEKGINSGEWMNRMLLAGGISDTKAEERPDGEDEAALTEYIWKNYVEPEMNFTHLYKTTDFSVDTDVQSPDEVIELTNNNFDWKFDNGYSTVMFAGHGAPTKFDSKILNTIYSLNDAQNANNLGAPSLVYADACTTAPYDKIDDNIGEFLIKKENAGAIGYIGALRVTWYVLNDYNFQVMNRGNAKLFWKTFFENKTYQQGKALYDSKLAYMNSYYFTQFSSINKEWERKNLLTYNLLGDPEVDIYTNIPKYAKNPLPSAIYEGQLLNFQIKDSKDKNIPFARVYLTDEIGAERTIYGDKNGNIAFRLPMGSNLSYNMTITGHNLKKSTFTFTTQPDTEKPNLLGVEIIPKIPSVNDNLCFELSAKDSKSGIESIFSYISNNSFKDTKYLRFKNHYLQNNSLFEINLDKLDPGQYKFQFYLIARDYLNNTESYESIINISISVPVVDYFLVGGLFTIGAISVVSIFIVYIRMKQYTKQSEEFDRYKF